MKSTDIPVFSPSYHVEIVEDEAVFLLNETEQNVLNGNFYTRVAPLIDGERSLDEIIDKLVADERNDVSLAESYFRLEVMQRNNFILDKALLADPFLAFVKSMRFIGNGLREQPCAISLVSLTSDEEVFSAVLEKLEKLDIKVDEEAELTVVLAEDYMDPRLERINAEQLVSGKPWLVIKPVGKIFWLGPFFYPDKTACMCCLQHRLKANREVESFLRSRTGNSQPFYPTKVLLPSLLDLGLGLAVTEIFKWFSSGRIPSRLQGAIMTFNAETLTTELHPLLRRPQCGACGRSRMDTWTPKELKLTSQKKTFTGDGGHRTRSPEETLENYRHLISPITGVVSYLSRATKPDSFIHSYYAGHNTAMHYDTLFMLRKGLRSKAGGKGKTDLQARVSGMCEAIERYSGLFHGDEYRVNGTYEALKDDAIHPNSCMLFSERQYIGREEWNKTASQFHIVPHPFPEDLPVDWTPIFSLTENRYKYIPTAYCYYNYNKKDTYFFCSADSNGNASGNTIEEAILQGFLELIERDSVSLWWYNRVSRPGVDLNSFQDPYFDQIIEYYRSIDREIWVIDLTADFNIPCFAAITRRVDKKAEDIMMGFGAHLDARLAISRAITEVNQFMPAVLDITKDGKGSYGFDDQAVIDWWKTATIENQPYLVRAASIPLKMKNDYENYQSDDLLNDVMYCKALVEEKGMEFLVLDQTLPDIKMPVVKVVVPGLRHFWTRFGAGRLYDVPVKLGWMEHVLPEEELNPVPMFI